jgi:hypothetical protein
MGMLRTTLILGAIIFAMPSPPPDASAPGEPAPLSTVAYLAAAAETFSDVKTFCERKPFVCQAAGQFASTVERKAKYSAKLIYEWANEASDQQAQTMLPADLASMADDIETGSTAGATEIAMLEIGPFLVPADDVLALPALRGSQFPG